jgi:hypothetical protein
MSRLGRAAAAMVLATTLGACGEKVVTRTTDGRTAAPTASVVGAPTVSPTPDPADVAIGRFVALVTRPNFSYQATFKGQDRHSTTILPISNGLVQVSGNNLLVRATFRFKDGYKGTAEYRSVGGKHWIRPDLASRWERLTVKSADSMAAFASVHRASDVRLVDTVGTGAKTQYKVEFRSAILNPVMIPASNLSDTALTDPTMTLLIDATGQPIRASTEINAKGRVSGQLQEIVIELTVDFSKVGQPVSIKAP